MFQSLLINLFLSYLTFDVPTQDSVLKLTREDQGGLYALASVAYGDAGEERQITVRFDDDCDYEKDVTLEDAFEVIYAEDMDVVKQDENGDLLLFSSLFGTDEAPDFLLEAEDGRFYFLKRRDASL